MLWSLSPHAARRRCPGLSGARRGVLWAMTGRGSDPFHLVRSAPALGPAAAHPTTSLLVNIGGRIALRVGDAQRRAVTDGGVWNTFGNLFSRNRGRISCFWLQAPSQITAVGHATEGERPARY